MTIYAKGAARLESSPQLPTRLLRTVKVLSVAAGVTIGGAFVYNQDPDILDSLPGFSDALPAAAAAEAMDPSDPCYAWYANREAAVTMQAAVNNVAQANIVQKGLAPGATIAVGCGDMLLAMAAVGETGDGKPVSGMETEYDLASVSKMFTTTAVLMLQQEGKLALDQPVGDFLPEYQSGDKAGVTFRMLLQHRSGIADSRYAQILAGTSSPEEVWQRLLTYPLANPPGQTYDYSNIGFNVVFAAASRAAGQPLQDYIEAQLLAPLGMAHTGYAPNVANCPPTSPDYDQNQLLTCVPQDELVRAQGNIGGHTGWFATAEDLGKFMAMLAERGSVQGRQLLTPENVALLATAQADSNYALGARTNKSKFASTRMSPAAFGHTGWNGTAGFVDPESLLWSVVLTNGTWHREAPTDTFYESLRAINDTFDQQSDALTAQ